MTQKKINILINREGIVFYTIYPLILNKKKLYDLGYKINFYFKLSKKLLDCDILILISKPTQNIIDKQKPSTTNNSNLLGYLSEIRSEVKKIIWFDNSDSSSVTNFEVMPYIDIYLKKQILINRSHYNSNLYGGRIFTDFYHKKFNVIDKKIYKNNFPLKKKYENKLRLSWNIGLGNVHNSFNSYYNLLRFFFPLFVIKKFNHNFVEPEKFREIDFFFRGSIKYNRNTIKFHREKLFNDLKAKLCKLNYVSVIGTNIFHKNSISAFIKKAKGKLSNTDYLKIQNNTKISFSPFGWGELGARDYEIIVGGSLLVKPRMDHMETWPNIFLPNKTYVPLEWDFSNLEEIFEIYIKNHKLRNEIISNSQQVYRESISDNGMNKFCSWFSRQIQ
tara:strand:+ start:168 stop:1334 length:1167 start_codon:yes stop_codon:yes gene_type:complete